MYIINDENLKEMSVYSLDTLYNLLKADVKQKKLKLATIHIFKLVMKGLVL